MSSSIIYNYFNIYKLRCMLLMSGKMQMILTQMVVIAHVCAFASISGSLVQMNFSDHIHYNQNVLKVC